ncbi:hypothetical protein BLAT2472_50126 [Burkholderia latens]
MSRHSLLREHSAIFFDLYEVIVGRAVTGLTRDVDVIPTAPHDRPEVFAYRRLPDRADASRVNDFTIQESLSHGRQKSASGGAAGRRDCGDRAGRKRRQHDRLDREHLRHARRARRQRRALDVGRARRRDLHRVDVGRV